MIYDRNLIDRAFYVVNHNIDPEFIPLAIFSAFGDKATISNPLFALLRNDQSLRFRLASVLSGRQNQQELHRRQRQDGQHYSPAFIKLILQLQLGKF